MKNLQKGLASIITVTLVILLLVLIAGTYSVYKKKASSTTTVGTVSSEFVAYKDEMNGFEVSYPKDSTDREGDDPTMVLAKGLPFVQETNLHEKILSVGVQPARATKCSMVEYANGVKTEKAVANGITFQKEERNEGAAGNYYQTTYYFTVKNDLCYLLQFTLHSVRRENYENPPPEFDVVAESKVFYQIFNTFKVGKVSPTISKTKTYFNSEYSFSFKYPEKYVLTPGADRYLVSFVYHNPAKTSDGDDTIHVTAFLDGGATSFKDYIAKNPILHQESGQPIPFEKFIPVILGGKTFYYRVGERFEGIFSTNYYYVTSTKVYLFDSRSYIGADWTDPNFDEANEPVHKDLKQLLSTLTFTK